MAVLDKVFLAALTLTRTRTRARTPTPTPTPTPTRARARARARALYPCPYRPPQGCFNPVNEKDNHPLDPMFNVQWPVPQGVEPEMSGKDTAAPTLAVRRPHLTGMKPRGRILIIGASGQVGGSAV